MQTRATSGNCGSKRPGTVAKTEFRTEDAKPLTRPLATHSPSDGERLHELPRFTDCAPEPWRGRGAPDESAAEAGRTPDASRASLRQRGREASGVRVSSATLLDRRKTQARQRLRFMGRDGVRGFRNLISANSIAPRQAALKTGPPPGNIAARISPPTLKQPGGVRVMRKNSCRFVDSV